MKKRILRAIFTALLVSGFLTLNSCADADGLHDQQALMVTFKFTGFGEISGSYAIPGNFNSWNNKGSDVTMAAGAGTSNAIAVTASNIEFSLVPVNEWKRPWFVADVRTGNGYDGSESKYHNFYINGLDLSAGTAVIEIDASSGTAVPKMK